MSTGSQFVMEGVKNLVVGTKVYFIYIIVLSWNSLQTMITAVQVIFIFIIIIIIYYYYLLLLLLSL